MPTAAATSSDAIVSPDLLVLQRALSERRMRHVARMTIGDLDVEIAHGSDDLWVLARRADRGGIALRAAHVPGGFVRSTRHAAHGQLDIALDGPIGTYRFGLCAGHDAMESLRVTTRFTPARSTVIPYQPRDLYPLDRHDDPLGADGVVEARQRGLNCGIVFCRIDRPAFGSVLYFQNFTALNPYFDATGTSPDESVGGTWPELGFLLPIAEARADPAAGQLAAGEELVLSDAVLVCRHDAPTHERESARQFLQMLGTAYKLIEQPEPVFRDWTWRARRTLRDLDRAPAATIRHYGHRYVHPYTGAEYPDVMVQMSLVAAIHDWGRWRGEPHPLEAAFKAGLRKFYDPKLATLRRYLPNVGKDKDADAVDSWYLYHPLLNLGRLASHGDRAARALFLDSIDFAIRVAHHFDYRWPVQFKITDLSVIDAVAPADGRGQTDVGGVYAWTMLQAFELTDEKHFLDEARAAIDAARGLRFDINYQANLTAWGAAACMRLWRITDDPVYLEQSYVYLASFFHNTQIWESQIKLARHFSNFMAVTCLQDAPYMAIYECFDAYTAFEHYLADSGPALDPAARMLVSEYCKFALHRAWFYYPDALPREALSDKQRDNNGHIDRALSFPVEDLYADGQPAGQVGQEIYGAGAAMVFATRAFHHVEGAPFRLYCDHFVRTSERIGDRGLSVTLDGGETCTAGVSLVRLPRRKLGAVRVVTAGGDHIRAHAATSDRIDFRVPANGRFVLTWT